MHIAILGTGNMARTLANGALAAGHSVVFGSREPSAKTDLPAPVTLAKEAIGPSDLVISAIAGDVALAALTDLRESLEGRVLLDIGNALTSDFDLLFPNSSLAEHIQEALPLTRVVKSLNTVAGAVGIDPEAIGRPTTIFLSGDDLEAKKLVGAFLHDLGWAKTSQLDLGDVKSARAVEHFFFLSFALMQEFEGAAVNVEVVHSPLEG